jgi:hypothetical protein
MSRYRHGLSHLRVASHTRNAELHPPGMVNHKHRGWRRGTHRSTESQDQERKFLGVKPESETTQAGQPLQPEPDS